MMASPPESPTSRGDGSPAPAEATPASDRRFTQGDALALGGLVLLAFAVLARVFHPGALIFGDHPVHQAEVRELLHTLLPEQGWVSGWSMQEFAGYPLYYYHYVLGPYLVAVVSAAPGIDLTLAYKLVFTASLAFAGGALYLLLRFRTGSVTSPSWGFLLAGLFLLLSRLQFQHAVGFWSQTLALGTFAFLWLALDRFFHRPSRRGWAALALLYALQILAHPYVCLAAGLLTLVLVGIHLRQTRRLRPSLAVAGAGFAGMGLAAFYLWPFLATFGWGAPPVLTPLPPSLAAMGITMLRETMDLHPYVFRAEGDLNARAALLQNLRFHLWLPAASRAALLLLAIALVRTIPSWRRLPLSCRGALLLAAVLFFFHLGWWTQPFSDFIRTSSLNNLLGSYRLLPVLWLAGTVLMADLAPIRRPRSAWKAALVAVAVLGLAGSASHHLFLPAPELAVESAAGENYNTLRRRWAGLADLPPSRGRIAVQSTVGHAPKPLSYSHVTCFIPALSGRPTFGAWAGGWRYPTAPVALSEFDNWWGDNIHTITPKRFRRIAREFNIDRLLLCDPDDANALVARGLLPPIEKHDNNFYLYNLDEPGYVMAATGTLDSATWQITSDRITAQFAHADAPREVLVSVAWHPYWKGRLDRKPVVLRPNDLGLITFPSPIPGAHYLELEFAPPRGIPGMVSFLTLFLVGAVAFRIGRRRSSASTSATTHP